MASKLFHFYRLQLLARRDNEFGIEKKTKLLQFGSPA